MSLATLQSQCSWHQSNSPLALSEIFDKQNVISVWTRQEKCDIQHYFGEVFQQLGLGVNGVFEIHTMREALEEALPEGSGKQAAIDDIFLLSDMLTCLFDCDSVGMRLAPLKKAMCPRFHVDNIPVRLVNTYLGQGTEWLPLEALLDDGNDDANHSHKTTFGARFDPHHIQQMRAFDVALLKGKAWEKGGNEAAIHRSCGVAENEKRVLLTLDPM